MLISVSNLLILLGLLYEQPFSNPRHRRRTVAKTACLKIVNTFLNLASEPFQFFFFG